MEKERSKDNWWRATSKLTTPVDSMWPGSLGQVSCRPFRLKMLYNDSTVKFEKPEDISYRVSPQNNKLCFVCPTKLASLRDDKSQFSLRHGSDIMITLSQILTQIGHQ